MTPSTPTKDRILDAAEVLFAERGYDGTSLRALTGAADVNLAAVHYHFGSKAALFRAVFERRVAPVNAERLRRLDAAEATARATGQPVDLRTALEAFLGPPLWMSARRDPGFGRFLRIVARMSSSSGEHALALRDVFHEVLRRFLPCFARVLPHLEEHDLLWRLHLVVGAMLTLFADPQRLAVLSENRCDAENPDEALAELVAFAEGALRAPSASSNAASARPETSSTPR